LGQNEIDAIRALLGSKPRPIGWSERRQRLDEVGSVWPVADDVSLEAVNCDGVPGEWSLASGQRHVPGSDILPWWRLLLRFDPESPPDGNGSGMRSAHARAGYWLPTPPRRTKDGPVASRPSLTGSKFVGHLVSSL
jgi:hypothetical protein